MAEYPVTFSRSARKELEKHPLLLAAVRRALAADDKLSLAAKQMADALGISAEEAYAKLLEMKKEAT